MKTLRHQVGKHLHRCPPPIARLTAVAAVTLALLAPPSSAQLSVERGWDMFTTAGGGTTKYLFGTQYVSMVGVPLTTFDFTTGTSGDFGRGIGTQPVGNADTIIKRLQVASVPGPAGSLPQTAAAIPFELEAVHLKTESPIDLGAGLHTYFITLQSERGGALSTGSMTIGFTNTAGGTFDSSFHLFFDIRQDAITGPIVSSVDDKVFSSASTGWSHFPIPSELLINNVNNLLNGSNQLADFHVPLVTETSPVPGDGVHQGIFVTAPEPGALSLLTLGLVVSVTRRRKK